MAEDALRKDLNECPVLRKGDYEYFIHPLTDGIPVIKPEILRSVAERFIDILDLNCDVIVTVEAMGIPTAAAISLLTGIPITVIRKRQYGLPGETKVQQVTGYSKNELYINGLKEGDRVVIVDDVISTGGTMCAILDTLINIIGCEVVDAGVIFRKSDVTDMVAQRFGIDIRSLFRVEVRDGHLTVLD